MIECLTRQLERAVHRGPLALNRLGAVVIDAGSMSEGVARGGHDSQWVGSAVPDPGPGLGSQECGAGD